MKRPWLALCLATVMVANVGCCLSRCGSPCSSCGTPNCHDCRNEGPECGGHGCGIRGALAARGRCADGACEDGPAGPPAATVSYPYYTVRGPRDFLSSNPGGVDTY